MTGIATSNKGNDHLASINSSAISRCEKRPLIATINLPTTDVQN